MVASNKVLQLVVLSLQRKELYMRSIFTEEGKQMTQQAKDKLYGLAVLAIVIATAWLEGTLCV